MKRPFEHITSASQMAKVAREAIRTAEATDSARHWNVAIEAIDHLRDLAGRALTPHILATFGEPGDTPDGPTPPTGDNEETETEEMDEQAGH